MKNINTEWTIDQVRAHAKPERHKLSSERVFVKGHEVPELSGTMWFPDGDDGDTVQCYTDRFNDVLSMALNPISGFAMQLGAVDRDSVDLNDAIETIIGLEIAARKRLNDFFDAIETHIGLPAVRRVSYGNKPGTKYHAEDHVAVEFLKWEVKP